jgi:pyruvate kinase
VRQTKIICTIGPVTESYEMLLAMANAGMNVARLNMSHGDHETHKRVIERIKKMNADTGHSVAMLMDTQGPEIRTGDLKSELHLVTGDEITVSVRGHESVEENSLQINYEDLITSVEVGDRITVDNGIINLEVLEKQQRTMKCRVIDGGVVKSKRHVNLPGIRVNLPAITEKDRRDVQFAIDNDLDFIALSFVRTPADVRELRALLEKGKSHIKIIAKIEDQEGLRNVSDIIREADAVMVARGDLGVEINIEDLPNVQRQIVRGCAIQGKPVIVATHLLESMIENPIPTRAEVTDVANAVYEEVDAIMLSGETTVGKYPIKCIEYMERVALASEKIRGLSFSKELSLDLPKQHLATCAVQLAEAVKAKGIIVITKRGLMATYACNSRPHGSPIYAFTFDPRVQRQMMLLRNVDARCFTPNSDSEKMIAEAFNMLMRSGDAILGDQFVVISDLIVKDGVDAIQLRSIPTM